MSDKIKLTELEIFNPNNVNEINRNILKIVFNENDIESKLPYGMRYKEFDTDYIGDTVKLRWVTQEPFSEADKEIFRKVINELIARLFTNTPDFNSVEVTLYVRYDRDSNNDWDYWEIKR